MAYALIENGELTQFPYTVEAFRQANRHISLPETPSDEQLAEVGLVKVEVATLPTSESGDKITGYEIGLVEGVWTQQWIVEEKTSGEIEADLATALAVRKAALRLELKTLQGTKFLQGFTYDFGEGVGEYTLDMRDADDKSNWTLLLIKCQGLIGAGASSYPIKVRAQNNQSFTTTAGTAALAMQAMLSWGEDMLKNKWDLDDDIDAATNDSELNLIDLSVGWP